MFPPKKVLFFETVSSTETEANSCLPDTFKLAEENSTFFTTTLQTGELVWPCTLPLCIQEQ